uniref:Uncharacterized protein n=1 Tax=viral metagenome TaxID=1070528 RepID=A0A6M3K298_9ZZZZ
MNECYICHAKVGEQHAEYCSVSPGKVICPHEFAAPYTDMECEYCGKKMGDAMRDGEYDPFDKIR